ncbi:hypothetical protein LTR10_014886 [Elasticomyces elasticus]|uniref:Transcription factor domain-containing protein n=1 Tax=Exophiala sideris TaxID=1016849 RepID=A0ABR0JFX0_9EURO|nr:hypothetical protein LTR10_014886 [Elasticomyces elasticus]KAK5025730.1 hypothetical protein LTS07_007934 [Exophiala sideris]KAK5033062.1 hypothetical protein LTR13_007027 [Exophiala sideris]KAK5063547.1 hypothetical protein LTR69_004253 [Exophiala sideris]KAK5180621.1 hypothetical protein LTR44_006935 [Eurotiomycetes sp. CCFEE 6388]
MRLKRQCVYKPRKEQRSFPTAAGTKDATAPEPVNATQSRRSRETTSVSPIPPSPRLENENHVLLQTLRLDDATNISWGAVQDPFRSPDSSIVDVTARLESALRRRKGKSPTSGDDESGAASPAALISRDIELTTTMDILTAQEVSLQPWFSFFVETVECPSITPYDCVNWRRMKYAVVDLGRTNAAVASATIAVSALYKGQLYNIPLSKASSLYQSSNSAYQTLLNDETQSFDAILTTTFLLCWFEFIQYEAIPHLKEPNDAFMDRLGTWARHESTRSALSLRIVAWLRLLHAATTRGGGLGLISERVCCLLPSSPSLPNLKSSAPDASSHLFEMLSTPIFEFYLDLQTISSEIARLTHYHRSRNTGVDQEEVIQQVEEVISRLRALWDNRSPTQRQSPEELRSLLASKIADPVITLIGICAAAYHAEFIEIDRVLGDPVSESAASKHAMRQVREIVDGDWNAYDQQGLLNAGYLRPLFLYAIECMDRGENQWAVERLERIKNPICRSDFFASVGKALTEAQLRKERRVTSKYFCIWYFGVPPPFM